MRTLLLFLILFSACFCASAQQTTQAQTGIPAPVLSGTGSPSALYTCSINFANILFIQLDSVTGRFWVCDFSTGSWLWDHLIAPVAIGNTGSIGGTAIVGIGCATGTVTITTAVQGTNVAIASPVTNPGLINSVLPPTISATIGAAGVITVSVCNPTSLVSFTPTASIYRVLVF